MRRLLMLALVLAAAGAVIVRLQLGRTAAAEPFDGPRIQGVTLDAREPPPEETFRALRAVGATHVALTVFGWQPGVDVPEVRFRPDARWFSESEGGIRALARQAAAHGVRLVVKPHLWLRSRDPEAWTARIGFRSEADWLRWEADYRAFILHYARVAAEVDAALFVIGTELAGAARSRPDFWRRLAAEVRAVYPGPITYAANWHDEFEHIEFWDALDFVGVQAYFPLSTRADPPLDALEAGWERHKRLVRRVAARAGRPVLFTEIGYRSVPDAAAEPWRWPARDELGRVRPDDAVQARLYEAFFRQLWHEPWFAGALVWKWYPAADRPRHAIDFTPQGKPAEEVIGRWFKVQRSRLDRRNLEP